MAYFKGLNVIFCSSNLSSKVQIIVSPIQGSDGGAEIRVIGGTPRTSYTFQEGKGKMKVKYLSNLSVNGNDIRISALWS